VSDAVVRDAVQSAYDRWASGYDSDVNATRDLDATVLRRQALGLEGKDVLELGCGTGKNTIWLAQQARHVVAFEFSAGMLDKARARLADASNVRFEVQDLREPWRVPDAAFDRVVCNLVLEHIEDLSFVFREAARVTKSGGSFFSSELHPFRQRVGAQAQFVGPDGVGTERIPAFLHDVSDYVAAGLAAGLTLSCLGEWHDELAPKSSLPRLLTQCWSRSG
jgi:ubiquinone/menaquinone biosynthesis C-methylase UbiE